MAGRPPVGAAFEVERVGRRGSRGPVAALAWVAVLAALIGLAVFGRGTTGEASASPAATDGIADLARLVPAPGDHVLVGTASDAPPVLDGAPIGLVSPPIGPVTVVTAQLAVTGSVHVRSDHVQVALQTRNDRTLEQATVSVGYGWNDLRPDVFPTFRVVFDLRAPRTLGTMWIEVTVYDARNRVLAYERRQFIVGPIRA